MYFKKKQCLGLDKEYIRKIIIVVLVVTSVISVIPKIFIGIDNDEPYIVTMAVRLANGERMFTDMWELHQTSAFWDAVLIRIYIMFAGSIDGVFVFLHVIAALFQFLVAIFTFVILKPYYKNADFVALYIANILPRTTLNFDYGEISFWMTWVSLLLLFLVYKEPLDRPKRIVISAISGVFLSLGVLSYPTIIGVVIAYLVAIVWGIKDAHKRQTILVTYFVTCLVCSFVFLGYILSYMSLNDFLRVIPKILMDGSHTQDSKIVQIIESVTKTPSIIAQFIIVIMLGELIGLLYKWVMKNKMPRVYHYIVVGCSIFVMVNLTGIKVTTPHGWSVRTLIVVVAGLMLLDKKEIIKDELFWYLWVPGVLLYIGVLVGSNCGIVPSAPFLIMSVSAVILWSDNTILKKKSQLQNNGSIYILFSLFMLIISTAFMKGFVIREDFPKVGTITEPLKHVYEGPLKGMYLEDGIWTEYMSRVGDIRENTNDSDVVLYLGRNAMYNLVDGVEFTSANTISTPEFNQQWVDYYSESSRKEPTIIFVDRERMGELDGFLDGTTFGQYISERVVEKKETDSFYILNVDF